MAVKRQTGQGGNSTRGSERVLYVSKTLSRNLQDSAVSWKQLRFSQKEILIKHNILEAITFFTKGNSNKTQYLTLTQKQFHCDRQRTPTPNKVDVFGTGKTLPGRADLKQH